MVEKHLTDGTTALAGQPRVIKIEAAEKSQNAQLRVAAYTRVSSDSDDQLNSFAAQNRYYAELISGKAEWRVVDIYADEGITGTSAAKREDFQRMMADCRRGLIDQILVKSISRFARNTKDCLEAVRELKELGVNVRFEREGIDTANVSSELITAIYAAFAQKESESISGNMRWSCQRRMEAGTFLPSSMAYGYKLVGRKIEIDADAALVVCRIFQWYLNGVNRTAIAKKLNEEGISSGQRKKWHSASVRYILTNEKYKGDALMQKCYTADFLTKKQVPNNGVLPQYYVEGNHEAIIPPETFELVQQEMLRRNNRDNRYSGVDIFASRIVCGECGSYYGAKVWHSNSKYRRIIYRCNHKYHDGKTCSTPNLTEDEIKLSFVAAVNRLIANKDEVIANLEGMCQTLFETETLESEREKLNTEMYLLQNMIQAAIAENAHVALEQNIYQKRFDELSGKYEDAKRQHDDIKRQIADKTSARTAASQFIGTLKKMDGLITEFDLSLWGSLLDHATVYSKEDMRYTFKDGTEIKL